MSGITDKLKWRPGGDGTSIKQQVSGIFRKDDAASKAGEHVSRPLSELRDPSSFGPPPKRIGAGSTLPPPAHGRPGPADPPRPSSTSQPAPPPLPVRYGDDGQSPPPPYTSPTTAAGPPGLPPRLPPRTSPSIQPPPPPPARRQVEPPARRDYTAHAARLGEAGASVPGLGGMRRNSGASSAPPAVGTGLTDLQSRFANRGATSAPPQSTTWAQKQAALQTAADLRRDPRSVSVGDAMSAASTINNFRQRHGDQVSAGMKSASSLNQKYGVSDKVGRHVGGAGEEASGESPLSGAGMAGALLAKKKPAPLPPKKNSQVLGILPPPVPLSSKPPL